MKKKKGDVYLPPTPSMGFPGAARSSLVVGRSFLQGRVGLQNASKMDLKFALQFDSCRFGAHLGPPSWPHVGLNVRFCFALVFKTRFGAFLDPSWSRLGVQVGAPKAPQVSKGRRV